MKKYERKLKVNKTGAYEFDVSNWANGEPLTSFAVSSDALCTVITQTESNGLITFTVTGVSVGVSEIHIEFATATTSDCFVANITVIEDC